MDTPRGIQLPKELLPAIQEFLPGELIVIFLHADTRRRTTDQYIVDLTEWTRTNGVDLLYERTWGTLTLGDERSVLEGFRESAAQSGRPMIVFYNFPQRFTCISYEADVSFHLLPGAEQSINVQLGKCRRAKTPTRTQNNVVLNIPERLVSPFPVSLGRAVEEGITIEVHGAPQTGKSWITALIAHALKKEIPDKHISVRSLELGFPEKLQKLEGKVSLKPGEFKIPSQRIVVVDGCMKPPKTPTIAAAIPGMQTIVVNDPTEEH
jgi:hypothetical protein